MTAFTTGADQHYESVQHLPPRDQARAMARWGYLQATRNLDRVELDRAARLYADDMGQEWDDITEAQRNACRQIIDHRCWNPACVNVDHLRLATPAQNNSYLSTTGRTSEKSPARNVRRAGNRWEVRLGASGHLYIGHFDTLEEAKAAAERARAEHYEEFAGRG